MGAQRHSEAIRVFHNFRSNSIKDVNGIVVFSQHGHCSELLPFAWVVGNPASYTITCIREPHSRITYPCFGDFGSCPLACKAYDRPIPTGVGFHNILIRPHPAKAKRNSTSPDSPTTNSTTVNIPSIHYTNTIRSAIATEQE